MESLLREKLEGIIKNDSDKGAGKRKEESRLQVRHSISKSK